MSGLLFLGVVGLWVWACVAMTRWIMRRIDSKPRRLLTGMGVFVLLLVLPVADEIVGGFQFRALCEKNASRFQMGVGNPEGRTTKVTFDQSDHVAEFTAIPISYSRLEYHDVATGELVVAFDSYSAQGGVFIRALGISNNDSPLTIDPSVCSPQNGTSVHRTMKFNVIN